MEHHHHDHSHEITEVKRAFVIGIALNLLFVVIEATAGFWTGSLALLTDAGHNLSDVASLSLSLLAFRLARVKATKRLTYGYRKSTVLVALLNAVILLIAVGSIGYEAMLRIFDPQPLQGKTIAVVAAFGILINGITAYLFLKDKEKDLNIKGAYLHLAADALVSGGVVVGGILMFYTGWYWLDSAISFLIIAAILGSTWGLLRDSLYLSLDAVPKGIQVEEISARLLRVAGVKRIHHVHVWAISTTQNALTAHLVVGNQANLSDIEAIKHDARHALLHLHVQHVTLEVEPEDVDCSAADC